MATTTPDNIRTPDAGDQYALVQDLGALADTVQNALVARANLYKGTSAQRTAFNTAPEGVMWKDTDGNKWLWVRSSGRWEPYNPPVTGRTTLSPNTTGSITSKTVPFPSGAFQSAPSVFTEIRNPMGHHQYLQWRISGVTATSFTVECRMINSPPTTYTLSIDWHAVG